MAQHKNTTSINENNPDKEFCLSLNDLAELFGQDPKVTLKELQKLCGPQRTVNHILPATVRKFIYAKGLRFSQQVVSFQMLKGGVAKTTSALNFGWRAAMYGARVLFIDLDQQANLTFALGVEDDSLPVWIDIVEKKVSIAQARRQLASGVDLIPSSLNNSVLDRVLLNGNRNWAQAVNGPVKELKAQYDLIIIDTAPNLSAINTAVTCASDLIVLPINPDKFSLLGVRKHLADLTEIKKDFDLEFDSRILFTRFDGRESASKEILGQCIAEFEEILLKNYVRTSTDIKTHVGGGRSIFSNKSNAKEDYDLVTKELLGL